ncbi:acyl-CoA thioester hydrolase/BAAT C-terminal domain-containing protein [Aeromicrobium sp. UC242_57]|uniref:acyl-CoA thioester hydrolase/BAAT C-terminal domain-containing protein n=1 Tax=Aeromicrobium sp. UC242_57 TaxID=3374624 RepID=UPI0037A0A413
MITLTGSGGGINHEEAQLLASRGFVCLALAYFNYPGRPDDLFEQPLEYFGEAAAWLASHPAVRPGAIAVKGQSRGAERSLLLAAHVPAVTAVVGIVPSGYVWGSFTSDGRDGAAWTLDALPVPTVSAEHLVAGRSVVVDGAVEATPGFRAAIESTPPHGWREQRSRSSAATAASCWCAVRMTRCGTPWRSATCCCVEPRTRLFRSTCDG